MHLLTIIVIILSVQVQEGVDGRGRGGRGAQLVGCDRLLQLLKLGTAEIPDEMQLIKNTLYL